MTNLKVKEKINKAFEDCCRHSVVISKRCPLEYLKREYPKNAPKESYIKRIAFDVIGKKKDKIILQSMVSFYCYSLTMKQFYNFTSAATSFFGIPVNDDYGNLKTLYRYLEKYYDRTTTKKQT